MEFIKEYEALCRKHGVFIDATCYMSVTIVNIGEEFSTQGGFEATLQDLVNEIEDE